MNDYNLLFSEYLKNQKLTKEPQNLYDPIQYILSLGGKRIRPILTLMACEIFGSQPQEALPAAMAVETFHNFSLIHDDIMDKAPLRRGKQTVHEKWNLNTGILSGDAMLILAYRYFEQYDPIVFAELSKLFSKTALEVCEGQQWDIDFETRNDVSISQYLKMIEYKTAVLVGAALKMGAIVARASQNNKKAIYNFGLYLGIAFQLQDDYLDAFGNPETFGKQIGGDIIENKKTYLYLKALLNATPEIQEKLRSLYTSDIENPDDKITSVKSIFIETKADQDIRQLIVDYTQKAFEIIKQTDIAEDKKNSLINFGIDLMNRNV